MAATTVTEFVAMPCSRCAGQGRIAQFQHRNGGECFRCGATGIDPQMREVERNMTMEEIIAAFPFEIINLTPAKEFGADVDFMDELFNHGGPTRGEMDAAIVAAYEAI